MKKQLKSKAQCQPEPSKETCQSEPIAQRMVITGVVSIEDTGHGVPGLAVEILHIGQTSVRLSSVVTGSAGRFSVTIEADQVKNLSLHNLNIQLLILTPERPGLVRADRILFETEVRENAALNELYLIEVTESLLVKKGLQRTVDKARPLSEKRAEALADTIKARLAASEITKKRAEAENSKAREHRRFYENVVVPKIRKELSTISENERRNPLFVSDEKEIYDCSTKSQHDELLKLNETEQNSEGVTTKKVKRYTRIQLEAGVLKRLGIGQPNGSPVTITQEQIETALGVPLDKPSSIQRAEVLSDPCRPLLQGEECTKSNEDSTSDRDDESTSGEEGDTVGGNVVFDSGVAVAALMDPQTAPEHTVSFDNLGTQLEGKIKIDDLEAAIGGMTLAPGPADVPSFHDFSSLQLAFESVWQEAIDDRILDDVESAYDRIVESGIVKPGEEPLDGSWTLFISQNLPPVPIAVPQPIASHIRISLEEYLALSSIIQGRLLDIGKAIDVHRISFMDGLDSDEELEEFEDELPSNPIYDRFRSNPASRGLQLNRTAIALLEKIRLLETEADRIVSHARQILIDREHGKPFRPSHEIIDRLRNARSNAYPFRHFAASASQRSVNFGIITTYRQLWTPVSYQVGDLVKTIPLGPKESRKYSKKEVQKRRRSEKEIESNLSNSKFDSETKSRAESEILAKATGKTSFANTSETSFNSGIEGAMSSGGKSTSSFTTNAERHSQDIKKNMRESVVKAAEERKRETKMEIETEESFESEFTESGELLNPNDEITCTFLFYELQRRYRINEKLHRLQSVVLVAQEMPEAREIDTVWLIQHDWILNRVLLDDSFKPALTYVSRTLVSDRETLSYMRRALLDQQSLVEQLKEDLADRRSSAGLRYAALERQIERTAQQSGGSGGIWDTITDAVGGGGLFNGILGGGDDGQDNASKIREDAAREAWDRERTEEQAFRNRLGDSQSTLASMRDKFNDKLSTHLGEVTQVERLATHIYQNIMYYMQAIWSHEPDDQRFLRLRDVPVPDLRPHKPGRNYHLEALGGELDFDNIVGMHGEYGLPPEEISTLPLEQIGDLSNPLGFMGNYMILPMYETNALTEFMMDPYVVFAKGEYGVSDPDPAGNMSLEEFSDYVCCLKKTLPAEQFEQLAPTLDDRLKKLLQRSVRDNEEIIVGTGNLYIEALPGAHSIMEQFKHLHRQIDVKTAQEELRTTAIDNVRRAQRVLNKDLEDPDIEAKYVFEGNGSATVVPPAPGGGA